MYNTTVKTRRDSLNGPVCHMTVEETRSQGLFPNGFPSQFFLKIYVIILGETYNKINLC